MGEFLNSFGLYIKVLIYVKYWLFGLVSFGLYLNYYYLYDSKVKIMSVLSSKNNIMSYFLVNMNLK